MLVSFSLITHESRRLDIARSETNVVATIVIADQNSTILFERFDLRSSEA
jgi:hypothetical protein